MKIKFLKYLNRRDRRGFYIYIVIPNLVRDPPFRDTDLSQDEGEEKDQKISLYLCASAVPKRFFNAFRMTRRIKKLLLNAELRRYGVLSILSLFEPQRRRDRRGFYIYIVIPNLVRDPPFRDTDLSQDDGEKKD